MSRSIFLRRRSSTCPTPESFSPISEYQVSDLGEFFSDVGVPNVQLPKLDWEIQLSGHTGRGDYSGVTVRPFFFGYTCISFWKQSGQMPWEKLLPVCVWM